MTPAKTASKKAATGKKSGVWSDEEKAAMRAIARERKAAASKEEGERACLAAIAEMQEPDRSMAKKIHVIIKATAPDLWPKTWYGMPAYARDDAVVCFFQPAQKFKARYSTLGFNGSAHLDEGSMWPTSYALTGLTAAEEAKIAALVKKAVS